MKLWKSKPSRCLNSSALAENSSSHILTCESIEPPMSRNRTLYGVPALGTHLDVEHSRRCSAVDRIVLSMSSSSSAPDTGELAQPTERHLDVARAELDRFVQVLVLALIPDLLRFLLALAEPARSFPAVLFRVVAFLAFLAFLAFFLPCASLPLRGPSGKAYDQLSRAHRAT